MSEKQLTKTIQMQADLIDQLKQAIKLLERRVMLLNRQVQTAKSATVQNKHDIAKVSRQVNNLTK